MQKKLEDKKKNTHTRDHFWDRYALLTPTVWFLSGFTLLGLRPSF